MSKSRLKLIGNHADPYALDDISAGAKYEGLRIEADLFTPGGGCVPAYVDP